VGKACVVNRVRARRLIATRRGLLVEIEMRRGLDAYRGYAVECGTRWCLLHLEREAALDGWVAVRLRNIKHVRTSRSFTARAIELAGESPTELPAIVLDTDVDVVSSAGEHAGLIGLAGRHGELRIGRLERASQLAIVLREVDTRARWAKRPTRFKTKEIAAVVIGGRYLDRLEMTLAASNRSVPEHEHDLDDAAAVEDTAPVDHASPIEPPATDDSATDDESDDSATDDEHVLSPAERLAAQRAVQESSESR
jgi:hypothetical protein